METRLRSVPPVHDREQLGAALPDAAIKARHG
jgi:hypothetical protein